MAAITQQPRTLTTKEADIQLMLAAEVHLGTKNCDFQMERYVFKRRNDGIYIINAGKTWDKLHMAARVIVSIENPQDIIVQSARPYGQRAVLISHNILVHMLLLAVTPLVPLPISFRLHTASQDFSFSLTQELITSLLRKLLLETSPLLPSVTLIHPCDMLTLVSLPTTKESTALVFSFGS